VTDEDKRTVHHRVRDREFDDSSKRGQQMVESARIPARPKTPPPPPPTSSGKREQSSPQE
jgi:hypothetical protein